MKQTHKILSAILAFLLFIGILSGCSKGPESIIPEVEPLSNKKIKEIEDAFVAENNYPITWFHSEDYVEREEGTRYYGTFNEYVILYFEGMGMTVWEIVIAGQTFSNANTFAIYAYKDGQFYKLQDAFEYGFLSEEDIAIIAQHHKIYKKFIGEYKDDE